MAMSSFRHGKIISGERQDPSQLQRPDTPIKDSVNLKKILVAVDGSVQSLRALTYASQAFDERVTAKIYILNVIAWMDEDEESLDSELASRIQEEGRRMLKSVIMTKKMDDYERVVKLGDPATKIAEVAEKLEIDMIIMGSKGLGNTKGDLGQVCSKVLKLTSKPVVVLK